MGRPTFRVGAVVGCTLVLQTGLSAFAAPSSEREVGMAARRSPVLVVGSAAEPRRDVSLMVATSTSSKEFRAVAQTRTRADGSFAIASDDVSALERASTSDGKVNAVVAVPDRGSYEMVDVVLEMSTSGSAPRLLNTVRLDLAGDTNASVARAAGQAAPRDVVPARVALVTSEASEGSATQDVGGARDATADDPDYCQDSYDKFMGKRKTFISGQYATNGGARVTAIFENNQSSTVGVGYSVNGKLGSFSQKGESSVERDLTLEFKMSRGNQHNYTDFTYSRCKRYCTIGGYKQFYGYRVKATGLAGDIARYSTPKAPAASKCGRLPKGTGFSLNKNRAWKNYYGADLDGVIGMNLSVESGYSSTQRIYYKADRWTVKLCGTNAYPQQFPQRIIVRSAK
ncbi:hypothetical protein AWH69_09740 [Janibacter melonis]|uniref:Uncharacterized protein n=2 Tax=Janibacter melonis TaxID=262209 RepID=A0A176QAP3_9MICO|nr:hypothetical protein AWH69_09740 [Janibacter melonis]